MDGTGLTPAVLAAMVLPPALIAGWIAGHGLPYRRRVLIPGVTMICGVGLAMVGIALADDGQVTPSFVGVAVLSTTALSLPGVVAGVWAGRGWRVRHPPTVRRSRRSAP